METVTGGQPEVDLDVDPRRWWTLMVLCLSLFMVIMGNTVLNVALPKMSEALSASGSQLQWIVDAYSLVFAGLLFTSGSLGDRFGRKGALTTGLLIFGLGSALATTADSAGVVIGCRAIMGLGAALVMPSTLSILTHVFPPEERAKAIGVWAGVAGAAGAVGPITSGWLLEHFYWGSVFWLNVPVVLTAIIGGYFLVPTSRHPDRVPLDPIGALLSIFAIVSLVYGVIEAPVYGWTDPLILASFVTAAVLMASFITWERQTADPMLHMSYFRRRGFTGGSLAMSMVFFGMFGMFFLLTQYLQMVRGYSALGAGVRTLPFSAVMMVAAPSSAALAARFTTRVVVTAGLAIAGCGMVLLALNTRTSGYGLLALSLCVLALGMGLTMAPSTASIMSSLPQAKAGVGSAMNDTVRELGGALGVAVLGSLAASAYSSTVSSVTTGLPPSVAADVSHSLGDTLRVAGEIGPRAGEVIGVAQQGFVDGMARGMTVGAAVAFVGAVVAAFVLPRRPGAEQPAPSEPEPAAALQH